MESTVKMLSLLEGTKFSANNDTSVLSVVVDLVYTQNKDLWKKNSPDREKLLELLAGKKTFGTQALHSAKEYQKLVLFIQGLILLAISLINGLGRSPINVQRSEQEELLVRINSKAQTIKLKPGIYDSEMSKLVKEFKLFFYGSAHDDSFSKTDCGLIKEAFKETETRLKNEKKFIEKVAKNPELIFESNLSETSFASFLFLLLSALPFESLNFLLINIGSYLPPELDEVNEDLFKVNVRNYLTATTSDAHELFKKIRLLLKLYFGRQRQIIAIIVKDKTQQLFQDLLKNASVKKEVQRNLTEAATNQFALRITILDGLVKLL